MNKMDIDDKTILNIAEDAAEILRERSADSFDVYVRWNSSISAEAREQKLDAFEQVQTWGVGIGRFCREAGSVRIRHRLA